MCVSLSSQQQKMMLAGIQCQQKMRLELYPAPAGLISMVNIVYSCVSISFVQKRVSFQDGALCSNSNCLLHLGSTMASGHPCTNEENSTYRQPLCSSDRPGARHQGSLPHVRDQPHPVLQLPSWGHAGEWGVVSHLQTEGWKEKDYLSRLSCDLCDAFEAIHWESNSKKCCIVLKLSAHIVSLPPFL